MTLPGAPPSLVPRAADGPSARLLSNDALTSLVTAEGSGFTQLGGQRITSWTPDALEDHEGVSLYLRDEEDGALWSLGLEPVPGMPDHYAAHGEPGLVRIERSERGLEARCEITVAANAHVELRRIRLRNAGARPRRLSLTSCLGVVLHHAAAHAGHPGFSKLFVQTSADAGAGILLARRRPRGPAPEPLHLAHALFGPGAASFETDRMRFVARGRSLARPAALAAGARLSGTVGSVLDPVLSWRREVALAPGETIELLSVLALAESEAAAHALAASMAAPGAFDAARAGAERRARAELARCGLTPAQGAYLEELLARILCGVPSLRAPADVFRRVRGEPGELQAFGIAPDLPLVVIEAGPEAARLARELETAISWWAGLGFAVRGLALGGAPAGGDAIVTPPGGVDPRRLDVARACARLVLDGAWPSLAASAAPRGATRARPGRDPDSGPPLAGTSPLRLANGVGGFSADGREYVIELPPDGGLPPLPWVNVLANPEFGALVSERGAAHTWSRNSREHRLTPWSDDPVLDPHGEALWVRDEAAGAFWSPQPGPTPGGGRGEVRHGFGYTRWRQRSHGLDQEVTTLVASDAPVKLTRVRLTNLAREPRRLSLFSYARLVLGVLPEDVAHATVTRPGSDGRTLLASNGLAGPFAGGVAFAAAASDAPGVEKFHGADRRGFVGVGGTLEQPRAIVEDAALDGRCGAGLEPCFAQQLRFELAAGASAEGLFLLGEGEDAAHAEALAARFTRPGACDEALARVRAQWDGVLGAVRVETPSPALDLMANGWLAYQTLACRLWGRTAFYQSGGAFGYRDQLQDAAALVHARPDLTHAQILLHAAHQFVEGDVLHWWHPPLERGTRTRFSDDLLWLPYVTAHYVATTGDRGVLDETAGFVTARPLADGEDEAYLQAAPAAERASVYEHCCRAIERSLRVGAHGLPLMGTGDWNDGMNRVGREGRGESVWMAFFLYDVLRSFEPLCAARGDAARAGRWAAHRAALARAVEEHAWDGGWYRRAWFDDGTLLGGAERDECRIDLLPQAWAVLSGAAPRTRCEQALDAVERELLLPEGKLIRLLAPPFDRSEPTPGYIQGYVPGIRENGGQYTHAASWAVRASAALGCRERALAWLEMILPPSHARTPAEVATYQVEPYVVAADIYAVPPHVGRGGWTWYTGSSGWLLRVALESVLGLRMEEGRRLVLRPCVPDAWPGFRIEYRLPGELTRYAIEVRNPGGACERVVALRVDGRALAPVDGAAVWPIAHDGGEHAVEVELGPAAP
jgi:cyclic beta-1,2-glucan synthetase